MYIATIFTNEGQFNKKQKKLRIELVIKKKVKRKKKLIQG